MHKGDIWNRNWVMIWTEERKKSGLWLDKKVELMKICFWSWMRE